MLGLGDAAGVGTDGLGSDLHSGRSVIPGLEGQMLQKSHPGKHPVAGLLEIDGPGIVIHVDGDLIHRGRGCITSMLGLARSSLRRVRI